MVKCRKSIGAGNLKLLSWEISPKAEGQSLTFNHPQLDLHNKMGEQKNAATA